MDTYDEVARSRACSYTVIGSIVNAFGTLHILADHHNVVGWWLVLKYMWTPPTHYYLESSEQAVDMENHP